MVFLNDNGKKYPGSAAGQDNNRPGPGRTRLFHDHKRSYSKRDMFQDSSFMQYIWPVAIGLFLTLFIEQAIL